MSMIRLLIENGIRPLVVFDGIPLPAKEKTNIARGSMKRTNRELARKLQEEGMFESAESLYRRSVSITHAMVCQVIDALRVANVDYIVSPYESDAQLAYLSMTNKVDAVISEDSDVLVFGCKRVLFKLNKEGVGQEVCRASLGANRDLTFLNWSDDQFKLMCCLAGAVLDIFAIILRLQYTNCIK